MSEYDGGFKEWCNRFRIVWNNLQKCDEEKYLTVEDSMRCHFVQMIFEIHESNHGFLKTPEEVAIVFSEMLKNLSVKHTEMKNDTKRGS